MSIVITLEVDDKGTATVKKFSDNTDKSLKKVEKTGADTSKSLTSGFDKLGNAALSTTTAIADFSLKLGALSLAAGAAAIAAVTNEAAKLEQQMSFLGAVLKDKTDANFAALSETVLELGGTTEWMSTQVGQAGEQLAKFGFSTDEVIGALPGTLSLATAGTIDLSEAASITAGTLRSFGITAKETTKVADVLAFTATNTGTTVSTIGESMTYIAPLARTAGITLQETSAAIGILADNNIKASMAGTTLRAAIASLLTPSKEQANLMKEMGLNVKDSSGNLISLTQVIEQLEVAGADTSDILELFGRRGGPGMAALLNRGSDALRDLTVQTENAGGTAQRVADEKLNNFYGQMTILKSATQNFMIALGDPLLPMFSDFLKVDVIPVVQSMSEWVKNNKDQVVAFGQDLMAFVRTSGEAISSFVTFMQSTGLPVISTIFKTVGDVMGFVSAMIVSVIDTLGFLAKTFEKVPAVIGNVIPGFNAMSSVMSTASEYSDGLRDSVENFGVTSISVGNQLSDMTMSVSELTWGLNNAADATHSNREAIEENEASTSTLAETVDGQLIPSLLDTQQAFEDSQRQAMMFGEAEYDLQDTTYETVGNMNASIDSLSNAWGSVTSSINDTDNALGNLNETVAEGVGGPVSYEVETTQDELAGYYDWLLSQSRYGFGPSGTNIHGFQDGGIVPGLPTDTIPAVLHGGERVVSNVQQGGASQSQSVVVELTLDGQVLASQIVNLNDKNVSGMADTFTPIAPNIRSSQESGV